MEVARLLEEAANMDPNVVGEYGWAIMQSAVFHNRIDVGAWLFKLSADYPVGIDVPGISLRPRTGTA